MKNKPVKFVFVLVLALVGCSTQKIQTNSHDQFDYSEFRRNRELWKGKKIKDYEMYVKAGGGLRYYPLVSIDVSDGRAISIGCLSEEERCVTDSYYKFSTLDKLFEFVEKAQATKPANLFVRYNNALGYPVEIDLDRRTEIADDEFWLKILRLEVKE